MATVGTKGLTMTASLDPVSSYQMPLSQRYNSLTLFKALLTWIS